MTTYVSTGCLWNRALTLLMAGFCVVLISFCIILIAATAAMLSTGVDDLAILSKLERISLAS